jgi:peptidoglycan/xylan/chitin deacetylase (PgdA/CDA1 family)
MAARRPLIYKPPERLSAICARAFSARLCIFLCALCGSSFFVESVSAQSTYLRINQVGYLASDTKVGIAFSRTPLSGDFVLLDVDTKQVIYRAALQTASAPSWGSSFPHHYELNFSAVKTAGRYLLQLAPDGATSKVFAIGDYPAYQEELLVFMRQQRCGYNPYLDMVCHQRDGRTVYAPVPDGTFIDASGGWHDAGDQLKYLITASNATARMLLAYELAKGKFQDQVDAFGHRQPNHIPDVLDEAKWGLDWIHKLHPAANQLFHQVADDRDHRGFKLPDQDIADYGWGANSYRPVYFADGKPQGLSQFKSKATGVANLAGRSAAAMAMAYRIWKNDLQEPLFAEQCLRAALDLYACGRRQEGYQQGNSYGAPYRYNEDTWADDLEWAAAELFKATGKPIYLADAKRYAQLSGATSWMQHDTTEHYQFYPFTNVGHFALYPLVDTKTRAQLAAYYRDGIERIIKRSRGNPYGVGVPFLWCSNNLVVAFITQVLLYEQMTKDRRYHAAMLAHRDWLWGCNPWGTSMFSGLPEGGEFPEDVHLPTVQILKKGVPGGLIDGPVYAKIYNSLLGLRLSQADEFAEVQPRDVVYHDDVGDYSTNEPTMDGTADAILMMAIFSRELRQLKKPAPATPVNRNRQTNETTYGFLFDQGAIIRGNRDAKQLALVFTGDDYGDGAEVIRRTLNRQGVKASFFFTGRFYRNANFQSIIQRLKREGNYLGAHSDQHLLYCDWQERNHLLISREKFAEDLQKNYAAMHRFGVRKAAARFFLPPFEWYNQTISDWTRQAGLQLINFTPGTRSNADYTTPEMKNYASSASILERIKEVEAADPAGLNGFILLLHLGVAPERTDKFYNRLGELLEWLKAKHYRLVRVDQLLNETVSGGDGKVVGARNRDSATSAKSPATSTVSIISRPDDRRGRRRFHVSAINSNW